MAIQKSTHTRMDWRFGLGWVFATMVGWILGFVLCDILKAFLYSLTHLNTDGAILGISVGIMQWFVLNWHTNFTRWWILASIVGFAIGKYAGDYLTASIVGPVGIGLSGAAIGILLGIAQWIVLRRYVDRASWWVLANLLAWTVGWSVINLVAETEGHPTNDAYIIGAVGAALVGVITGACLVWLFSNGWNRAEIAQTTA